MFFKVNNTNNTKNVDIACWCTFIFLGLILIVNSFSEIIFEKAAITSSLFILASGLMIFFSVEIILKSHKKTGRE